MNKIALTIIAAVTILAGCAADPVTPKYVTWKEKMEAEHPQTTSSQLHDFVLHDMMYQAATPMIDPTQMR